jgi:histidinol phosphatase-like PHP family hydrolase
MSQRYKKVVTPYGQYAFTDHIERAEALSKIRESYRNQIVEAQKFLAQSDDEIRIYQCIGLYREKNIRELTPSTT